VREVSVIGIGQTKVGERWDKSLRELAVESILAAMDDADIERTDALIVGNMLSSRLASQGHLGALLADFAGLRGLEAMTLDAACGSGGAAVRAGYIGVASGLYDLVIVCGVEKMTDQFGCPTTAALALAADGDYEAAQGLSFVAINALLMRRYMYEYDVKHDDFAPFTLNAHRNAVGNPYSMFPRPVTLEEFRQAKKIADPIGLLDSSPIADGSASLVLCPTDMAKSLGRSPLVGIVGSAVATDSLALHDRRELLFFQAAHDSAYEAYRLAGVSPDQIDFFELHDAFTITAALSLEACGFAERGEGVRLAMEGEIRREGRIPICTMGGLKGRGHPVVASGVYQVLEAVEQLRGQAGPNQIGARLGMAQSSGGSGATVFTHILERME